MTRITLTCEVGEEHKAFLESQLQAACDMIADPPQELSVAVIDGDTMSRLHERFLGKPQQTDVLSFPLAQDATGQVVEGEVVICLPVAEREAAVRRHPVEHELLLYALHGVLHLCGYDDLEESSNAVMHEKEDHIMRQLGLGPVFARHAEGR